MTTDGTEKLVKRDLRYLRDRVVSEVRIKDSHIQNALLDHVDREIGHLDLFVTAAVGLHSIGVVVRRESGARRLDRVSERVAFERTIHHALLVKGAVRKVSEIGFCANDGIFFEIAEDFLLILLENGKLWVQTATYICES